MVLQRGTKVVGRRTVIDSWKPRHSTQLQPFTFRVPAGSYLVSAPPFHKTVVIEAGQTTKVTLPNVCGNRGNEPMGCVPECSSRCGLPTSPRTPGRRRLSPGVRLPGAN